MSAESAELCSNLRMLKLSGAWYGKYLGIVSEGEGGTMAQWDQPARLPNRIELWEPLPKKS